VSIAGVAGQTALSGSQIKPPALPEVHDFREKGFFLTTTEFAEYRSIFHNTALSALRCAGFGLLHRDLVNMA
jgi:hypothetical protein